MEILEIGKGIRGKCSALVVSRSSVHVDRLDIGPEADHQVVHEGNLAVLGRDVHGRVAPVVRGVQIGARPEEGVCCLGGSGDCGPVQGALTGGVDGIEAGALLDQVGHDLGAVVEGGPLERIKAVDGALNALRVRCDEGLKLLELAVRAGLPGTVNVRGLGDRLARSSAVHNQT